MAKRYEVHTTDGVKCVDNIDDFIQIIRKYIIHRMNAPAIVAYKDGQLIFEHYYQNNKLHRLDGYAIKNYRNGVLYNGQYLIKGKQLTEGEFQDYLFRLKLNL